MRYAVALLLGMALALPAQAQNTAAATAAQDARAAKVTEAIAVLKSSNPAGAIALVDPVIAEYERDYPASGPNVFCANGTTEVIMGLVTGAAATKKDTVALNDTWCYAYWAKGYALVELGRLDDAVAPLTRAAQLMPSNAQFHTELGYVHQTLKHWNESNAAYNAAVTAAQRMPEGDSRNLSLRRAYFGLGFNEIELGQLDAAEKHMEQALKLAPNDPKIRNELDYIKEQKAKKSGKPN